MEKYGTAGQATDDTVIRCFRIACWISKATNTHSQYIELYCFPTAKVVTITHLNITFKSTLPVLFHFIQNQQEKAKECALLRSN
jgi:hypothetical protein